MVARIARAAFQAGRVAEAADAYQEAIDGFAAEGEVVGQGEALNRLSSALWNQGEARRSRDALVRAVQLLERARPGPELCSAYAQMAMDRVMLGIRRRRLAGRTRPSSWPRSSVGCPRSGCEPSTPAGLRVGPGRPRRS